MSGHLKFQCKHCEKKISVRAAYAGKRVKCPGCGEALRVPSPRPKRSATGVPVMVGASSSETTGSGASSISLEALAAMEANAPLELKELSTKSTAQPESMRVPGGKECPSCAASVKPDAAICVHCGHSFESGKQLKTKKSKEKTTARQRREGQVLSDEQGMGLRILYLVYGALFAFMGVFISIQAMNASPQELQRMVEEGNQLASLPVPVMILIGVVLFSSGLCLGWAGCHARLDFSKPITRLISVGGGLPVALIGAAIIVMPLISLAMGEKARFGGVIIGLIIMPAGAKMLMNGIRGRAS